MNVVMEDFEEANYATFIYKTPFSLRDKGLERSSIFVDGKEIRLTSADLFAEALAEALRIVDFEDSTKDNCDPKKKVLTEFSINKKITGQIKLPSSGETVSISKILTVNETTYLGSLMSEDEYKRDSEKEVGVAQTAAHLKYFGGSTKGIRTRDGYSMPFYPHMTVYDSKGNLIRLES